MERKFLMEHESKDLLEKYGIRTAKCIFSRNLNEAITAAKNLGFPLVMKVASRKIVHKSEVGGVRFVYNEKDLVKNFEELMKIRGAEGVNVQQMFERGFELFVGVAEDQQFGSFLAVGLGGVFFSAIKDYSIRLLPVSRKDLEEMFRELSSREILMKLDTEAVINLLLKLNEFVEKENVIEMDLNPVFVYKKGYVVVDARIVVGKKKDFSREIRKVILDPESVAVVGASNNPRKVGYAVVQSLRSNKNLKIYPVNPNLKEIDGIPTYKIEDLSVDLAVICLPAEKVVETVEKLVGRAKEALIVSAGFKEAEVEEGKIREERLRELSRNIRIIGPNVFGFVNVIKKINASFTPTFSNLKAGRIALVSQSGGICHYILHKFDVGFSYIVHLGNRCDVDFPDVFDFLEKDQNTKVVAVYVEGVDNGRAFFDGIRKLRNSGKYVVVLKAGKSSVADVASLSHTGSLAGDYRIFASSMKQAGAVLVEDPVELIDSAVLLEKYGEIKSVAIVAIQAGLGIVAADIIESRGGKLAKLSEKTLKEIKNILPPITFRENPIDVSASGLDSEKLRKIFETLWSDENVGVVLFCYAEAPPVWIISEDVFKKEIVVWIPEKRLKDVVVFDSIERAAKALAAITKCF
ncbi:MAG: acetate--CoA ligase family protein [Archaeoglobaceae archaeon]|nr:acetate--CoA ligase family protein [Archaeoglobaceae archaeon]MCX8152615.1 acetate--CoA ligase family protein [Archaeoglobaceae archaeon]